jgi:hypothetical protein
LRCALLKETVLLDDQKPVFAMRAVIGRKIHNHKVKQALPGCLWLTLTGRQSECTGNTQSSPPVQSTIPDLNAQSNDDVAGFIWQAMAS